MSTTTKYMNLTAWDSASDTFDYSKLADNFKAIDKHDHGANGGAPIDGVHISPGTINQTQLATNSVGTDQIINFNITRSKLADGIAPVLVTTLPDVSNWNATYDGYEIYYQTTDMGSRVWHLRFKFNDTTAGNIKTWQFVGGSPVTSFSDNIKYVSANDSWIRLDQVGSGNKPVINVPKGKYYVIGTARGSFTYTSANSGMYLAVNDTTPSDTSMATSFAPPYIASQTNLGSSMTVVNDVTVDVKKNLYLWGRTHNGVVSGGSGASQSNYTICSISATPIYINAVQ